MHMKDVLARDHSEIDDLLRRARHALDQSDHAAAFRFLDLLWARLAVHIRVENTLLFPTLERARRERLAADPRLQQQGPPSLPLLAKLRQDHDFFMRELTRAVLTLKRLCREPYSRDAHAVRSELQRCLAAVEDRLRDHNRLEESEVYGQPDQWLGVRELEQLERNIVQDLHRLPARWACDREPPH